MEFEVWGAVWAKFGTLVGGCDNLPHSRGAGFQVILFAMKNRLLAAATLLSPIVWALAATGCVQVKPWQRELLASPAMNPALLDTELSGTYRAKAMESKTAGGLPGTAPGGGCGCTQ